MFAKSPRAIEVTTDYRMIVKIASYNGAHSVSSTHFHFVIRNIKKRFSLIRSNDSMYLKFIVR